MQSMTWPCFAHFTSERCKPAKNWDIDPEQTFSISLYFSSCPLRDIQTSLLHLHTYLFSVIITHTKAPSPSVCKTYSCGARVWQKLGYDLFLVPSDSEHHQHHRRERRPQHQNDPLSVRGLDHRLPRRHQRDRLLREGSGEDGWHDERKIWRTPLVPFPWTFVFPLNFHRWCTSALFFPMWCCSVSWSGV